MEIIVKETKQEMSQRKLEGYLKLAEIVQWGRKAPVKFCERFYGIEFLDNQKYVFMMSWVTPFNVWCQSRNSGKALALDTPIPTPNGFKTMEDLKVGDYVIDADGNPTRVIYVSDIFLNHKCYEVEFEDGEKVIADADHLWYVQTKYSRKMIGKPREKSYKTKDMYDHIDENGFIVINTEKIFKDYIKVRPDGKGKEYKYRVPLTKPVQYPEKELPIHPYLLGVWLGDGFTDSVRVACGYDDIYEMCDHIESVGYSTKIYHNSDRAPTIGIDVGRKSTKNTTKEKFKQLGLLGNKHIPNDYLYSSVEQRFELLRGLMDTDGYCNKTTGECEFTQKSYILIQQFSQLLSSLGIKNKIKKRKVRCNGKECEAYRVLFFVDKSISCFKLKRKHNLLKDRLNKRSKNKSIVSIKEVPSVPTKCIGVDNSQSLYLFGSSFTVTHNTTLAAPFIMAKTNLIPNFQAYIMSGVGSQAQEAFLKIEKIAKREIASFTGLTDVFYNETVKSVANTDGFTHNPASFQYKLYNGSAVNSLNGAFDNNRSKRSNLNFYDEAGFAPEEMFETSMPFLAQDSNFKLGGDINVSLLPKEFPNQVIAASSASSTDTYFYKLYRDYAKKMIMGDKRFFVADINAEIVINATFNGKKYPGLLRQEVIDDAMKKNKEKALREYYNKFSTEGGENQAIKRSVIIRNSEVRPPTLYNANGSKFALAYDPARSYDNSVVMVGEIYWDENVGYKMKICNGVSFVDISKKTKTPMRTPEQKKHLKQMILDYNGKNAADYENITALLIDSGAGGGGVNIADDFMEDWYDDQGNKHRGLIDKKESADYISKFPNAVDKLKLMNPKKYKTEMFDALVEMLGLDLISFTDEYDLKGQLTLFETSEIEYEDENKNKQKDLTSTQKIYKLTADEEMALKNIDLAKEELVNIYRYDSPNGGKRYSLSPDKESKMHDDRAYCLAMLAWHLQQLRRESILNRTSKKIDWSNAPSFISSVSY